MLRFYIVSIIFVVLIIAAIVFANTVVCPLCLFGVLLLIYSLAIIRGAANIRSRMFVQTISSNPLANGKIAITFDDGPDPIITPQVLSVLQKYNAKASFFAIGSKLENNIGIAQQIISEGHLLGNHSYSHSSKFPLFLPKKMVRDIQKTQEILHTILGHKNIYFRPPFGVTNPFLARALKKFNFKSIGWTIRSMDTTSKNKEDILSSITKNLKNGDIILLHDRTQHVSWLTEEILIFIKNKGFEAVTVENLLS